MNTNSNDNDFQLLSLLGHYAALRSANDVGVRLIDLQNAGLGDQVIDFLAGLGINPEAFDDTVVAVLQTIIEVGVLLEQADQRAAANLPQGADTDVATWAAAQSADDHRVDGKPVYEMVNRLAREGTLAMVIDAGRKALAKGHGASPVNDAGRKLVHWYDVDSSNEVGCLISELPDGFYILNTAPDVNFVMGPFLTVQAVATHLDATEHLYPDEAIIEVHNSGRAESGTEPYMDGRFSPRTY